MRELELTDLENRLFNAAENTQNDAKQERSVILWAIVFCLVFAGIAYQHWFSGWIVAALVLYAVVHLSEVLGFAKAIGAYRNIRLKIAQKLLDLTQDDDYRKMFAESQDASLEMALSRNTLVLTICFVSILILSRFLPYPDLISGTVTVFYILLFLRLKLAAIRTVIFYKKSISRHTETLKAILAARKETPPEPPKTEEVVPQDKA